MTEPMTTPLTDEERGIIRDWFATSRSANVQLLVLRMLDEIERLKDTVRILNGDRETLVGAENAWKAKAESAEHRLAEAQKALDTIAGGWTDRFPGAPDVMKATSPADFRSAMWTWSQAVAKAALSSPAKEK